MMMIKGIILEDDTVISIEQAKELFKNLAELFGGDSYGFYPPQSKLHVGIDPGAKDQSATAIAMRQRQHELATVKMEIDNEIAISKLQQMQNSYSNGIKLQEVKTKAP